MRFPTVIFSFKLYKIFLAGGLTLTALGMDQWVNHGQSVGLLLLALIFHSFAVLNFFGGTIIVTKNYVIFVMSFVVRIRRRNDILRFELDPYVWWVKRLRLAAVMKNGARLVVSDINKAAEDDRDTHPERLAQRLNDLLALKNG